MTSGPVGVCAWPSWHCFYCVRFCVIVRVSRFEHFECNAPTNVRRICYLCKKICLATFGVSKILERRNTRQCNVPSFSVERTIVYRYEVVVLLMKWRLITLFLSKIPSLGMWHHMCSNVNKVKCRSTGYWTTFAPVGFHETTAKAISAAVPGAGKRGCGIDAGLERTLYRAFHVALDSCPAEIRLCCWSLCCRCSRRCW